MVEIYYCVISCVEKRNDYQDKEIYVIVSTNAVIQPFAMMIEHFYASIALFTMKGLTTHISLANIAGNGTNSKLYSIIVKLNTCLLLLYDVVLEWDQSDLSWLLCTTRQFGLKK